MQREKSVSYIDYVHGIGNGSINPLHPCPIIVHVSNRSLRELSVQVSMLRTYILVYVKLTGGV